MSRYWNHIVINQLFSKPKKKNVKYKINTKIGRFYFYFEKKEDSTITGKVIFFPNQK